MFRVLKNFTLGGVLFAEGEDPFSEKKRRLSSDQKAKLRSKLESFKERGLIEESAPTQAPVAPATEEPSAPKRSRKRRKNSGSGSPAS